MMIYNFHNLKFETPDSYLLVKNDTFDSYINANNGHLGSWFFPPKDPFDSGLMAMIFDPEKILIDSGYALPSEYIELTIKQNCTYPRIAQEEFLAEQKKIDEEGRQTEEYGQISEGRLLLSSISNVSAVPSFSKFSVHSEEKWKIKDIKERYTCVHQYAFFPFEGSKNNYSITLHCYEDNKGSSIVTFKNIMDSIKIK